MERENFKVRHLIKLFFCLFVLFLSDIKEKSAKRMETRLLFAPCSFSSQTSGAEKMTRTGPYDRRGEVAVARGRMGGRHTER